MNASLVNKASNNQTIIEGNLISLPNNPTLVKLHLDQNQIKNLENINNDLIVNLLDDSQVKLEGFFNADHNLVLKTSDDKLLSVVLKDEFGELVDTPWYQEIDSIDDINSDSYADPWAWLFRCRIRYIIFRILMALRSRTIICPSENTSHA